MAFKPTFMKNHERGLTEALGVMNKPSIGVLVFIAVVGAISGVMAVFIAPPSLYPTSVSFGALLLLGAGIVLCLYLFAPDRWHSMAGLHYGRASSGSSASATTIGRASAVGAVVGPAIIAALAAGTGWGKNAIISCMGAVLSGFALALVILWAILLIRAKRSAQ